MRPFHATFASRCPWCGDAIDVGQSILRADAGWLHAECAGAEAHEQQVADERVRWAGHDPAGLALAVLAYRSWA